MDDWTCQDCGEEAWQVHHEEYAPEGETACLDVLVALCPTCHGRRHGVSAISPLAPPTQTERYTVTVSDELGEWLDDQPHLSPSGLLQKAIREQREKEAE
jgi:5-methylcytosine-specific restriction endonuclease McrA